MAGKNGNKTFGCSGKGASVGIVVDDAVLAKINRFALKELTIEEVFVRKILLAHNGIDRDRERFPEGLLDDFARTLPGKSVLYFHNKGSFLPLGLFFDTLTETMAIEQFKTLTGDDPRLPDGLTQVKVLWAWYYVVKTPDIESTLANIEGGVYRHWSLGFGAADLIPIRKDVNGPVAYWEYMAPGEAYEGSLVWLGAQQGATSQKSAGKDKEPDHNQEGEKSMKKILVLFGALLGGKVFAEDTTDETLAAAVKAALDAKDAEIDTLKKKAAELEPLAADGKSYRDSLAADYARLKALMGECEETPEAKEKMVGFAKSFGIDFIKTEVKHLQARVDAKFPDGQQLAGDMRRDKSADLDGGDDNPLIPKAAAK